MRSAAVLAVLGIGLLSAMDLVIKLVTARYPVVEVAFIRFAVGSLLASLVMLWVRPGWPGRETILVNGSRSVLIAVTATTFFYALATLPLAEAVALSFSAPLMIALLGVAILKERLTGRIAATLAIGFTGMLIIVGGQMALAEGRSLSPFGVAAAIVSAFTYALAMVLLRARASRDPVSTIVWFQNVGPALILALPAAMVWTEPSLPDLGLFLLIGFLGIAGHMALAHAFARAEAGRLAPIEYTALVWSGLFGFLFFEEIPGVATVVGAGVIVAVTLWSQMEAKPAAAAVREGAAP